jgi:hypothetical protein
MNDVAPLPLGCVGIAQGQAQLLLLVNPVHPDGDIMMSNAMKVVGIGVLLFPLPLL